MKTVFVDATVFLRFFTADDTRQQARAGALFRRAIAGGLKLLTGPPVLFELAWTLRSAYKVSRPAILETLAAIVAMPNLELVDRPVVESALNKAALAGVDFADAYIAALAERHQCAGIATFNRRDFTALKSALWLM